MASKRKPGSLHTNTGCTRKKQTTTKYAPRTVRANALHTTGFLWVILKASENKNKKHLNDQLGPGFQTQEANSKGHEPRTVKTCFWPKGSFTFARQKGIPFGPKHLPAHLHGTQQILCSRVTTFWEKNRVRAWPTPVVQHAENSLGSALQSIAWGRFFWVELIRREPTKQKRTSVPVNNGL